MKEKEIIEDLLIKADVRIDGDRPGDIKVHNDEFYGRIMSGGSLALGEAYMDGWWDAEHLDVFFHKILSADLGAAVRGDWKVLLKAGKYVIANQQSLRKAYEVGEQHYDLGNDLYETMLDESMTYTCGYWPEADNLAQAQEAKLDLVCRKIGVKKGQKVLDIGCGWGSFGIHAARNYGAEVVGVTVSKEQAELGNKKAAGLPVELLLQDYREVEGEFDHIVSLGMFEHVGVKNYQVFMKTVQRLLKDDGLFLLHTIGDNKSKRKGNAWMEKYIFPNGMLPSIAQIGKVVERKFIMEDWHNFGTDYDKTLIAWRENFQGGWDGLKDKYDDRFYRMWNYYLSSTAGTFRARKVQLWQIVLSKNGVEGGYASVR